MPNSSKSIIATITLCLLIVCSAVISQDTPEVPDASSNSNAKPTLAELMARFSEIESSYLPFHIDYSESMTRKLGPFLAGVTDDEPSYEYRAECGHRDPKVWMRETTITNAGVSRTERSVNNETGYHLKETLPLPGRFFDDDGVSESAEPQVRPLEGVFPLMFHTDAPILISQHYAAEPNEFTLHWHDKLARVWCRHRSDNGLHAQVDLWLDPDFAWHPVFMRRYLIKGEPLSVGDRYPDEWKATEFRKLNELVRVSAGEFSGPIRRNAKTDESKEAFVRSRFRILKSTYQTRVPDLVFSPETPIGGSPIAELEPVGGEQVEVKSSDIAALSPPALTPEQRIAFTAVTNQQSVAEMRPAAAVNPTSTALPDEIQSQIAALEAELAVQKADLGESHPTIKKLNDKIAALRVTGAELLGPVTVLYLKNAKAKDVAEKIEQLFPGKTHNLVVDERTNSLMLRGDQKIIRDVEQIVQILDEDVPTAREQVNADPNVAPEEKTLGDSLPFTARPSPFGGRTSNRTSPAENFAPKNRRLSAGPDEDELLKTYLLQNCEARNSAIIIEQMFDNRVTVAADERTNSLIVRTQEALHQQIESLLIQLDEVPDRAPQATGAIGSSSPDASESTVLLADFRHRLANLEQPVVQLAEKVRAAEATLGKDHPDAVKQRAELRALVQKTFAERQEIQRAELAEFTRRLQHMQRSIETREKIADKIVDRRVEVLLDPDVDWGDSISTASPPKSTDDMGRDQATSDLEAVSPLHPQEPFPIDSPLEERPAVSRDVPENRAQLGQCMDALLRDIDEFEDRTPLKLLMEFKDQPVLQITDDFKAAVSSLREQIKLDAPRAKLEECLAPVSQHGAAFVQAWNNVKSQPAKVVLSEIADDIVSLERCIESLDQVERNGAKLNSAPEPLAVKQNVAELEPDKETVSLTLFEVTDAKFMPSDDTSVRQTAAPADFDDQLANMLKNKTAKVIGKHTIGTTRNQLATVHSGGKFEVPSSSTEEKAEVVFGTTIEITPRTSNGERVFQILWNERVRNFENAVSGIPGIDEKRIEVNITSPSPGGAGYLFGPLKGKNQTRRLFVHFLLEASPNVAARTQPQTEAIQIRLRCDHRMSLDSGDVVFADDGRVAIASRTVGMPMGFNFVEGDDRGPYQLTFEPNGSSEEAQTWLNNHVLPVEFLAEDQERAASGQLVAKVIYLKSGHTTVETANASQIETISSHNIEAGVDPVSVTAEKGTIIGVIRISKGAIRSVGSDSDNRPPRSSP